MALSETQELSPAAVGRSRPARRPCGAGDPGVASECGTAPASDSGVQPGPVYDAFRRQIEHEDNLIGQRTSWLLMAESFLVVGYCILHQLAPPDPRLQPVTGLLSSLVAWLGLTAAAFALLGVVAAAQAMRTLRVELGRRVAGWPALGDYLALVPALQPGGVTLLLGRLPAVGLPLVIGLFWLTLIVAAWIRG
jgi:hypothetical protein